MLLPICRKILTKLLFNKIVKFFIGNKSFSSNKSGPKPGDSYIRQLLSITHERDKSFDEGLELKACSLIYQKHLIRREMMISYSN